MSAAGEAHHYLQPVMIQWLGTTSLLHGRTRDVDWDWEENTRARGFMLTA